MAIVVFTPNLKRHVECPTETVEGTTVRAVLDVVFSRGRGESWSVVSNYLPPVHAVTFAS